MRHLAIPLLLLVLALIAVPKSLTCKKDLIKLKQQSQQIVSLLKTYSIKQLAHHIHPSKGILFSPETYIDKGDLILTPEELIHAAKTETPYLWGSEDGTGHPIKQALKDYWDRYVYDKEYEKAEKISYDQILKQGNTINNIKEHFPSTTVVEYHFSGFDPTYQGMDWKSLRLVFEYIDCTWYLSAIIHDEWTI